MTQEISEIAAIPDRSQVGLRLDEDSLSRRRRRITTSDAGHNLLLIQAGRG
jgi:hypothetical protein